MPRSNFYWEMYSESAEQKQKRGGDEHLQHTLVCPTGGERVWGQGEDESANSLLPT